MGVKVTRRGRRRKPRPIGVKYAEVHDQWVEIQVFESFQEANGSRKPKKKAKSRTRGNVYFVQQGTDGPIKIGFTTGPVEIRLTALQVGSPYPLHLLLLLEAKSSLETELHHRFEKHRLKGEWFRPTSDLINYIGSRAEDTYAV